MTLYTSEHNFHSCGRTAFVYTLIAGFCAVLGMVYERFSHGVWSEAMVYAFLYPLLAGAIPFLALGLFAKRKLPGSGVQLVWHCGIATLTLGSILRGVIEIYGTANELTVCYGIAGWTLLAAGLILYFHDIFPTKTH